MTSLLDPLFLKGTVQICINGNPLGSGFLYATKTIEGKIKQAYFVSNRHVAEGCFSSDKKPSLKLNVKPAAKQIEIVPEGWIYHTKKGVDLAVLPVNISFFLENGSDHFFISNEADYIGDRDTFENLVYSGSDVFLLGFPLGINGVAFSSPIARSGIIARTDSELLNDGKFFLDISNFEGNSGGPIILKPQLATIGTLPKTNNGKVIGVVSARLNFQQHLKDDQGNARMILIENADIAIAHPFYEAIKIIKHYETYRK